MCLSQAWLDGHRNYNQGQTDKVSTIDMETIISRFYHIIQIIVTHSAVHLVHCCHGQMSLLQFRILLSSSMMCSYGVSEVGTGAGEQVDRMMNGTDLAPESIAGLGASEGGRVMGAESVCQH